MPKHYDSPAKEAEQTEKDEKNLSQVKVSLDMSSFDALCSALDKFVFFSFRPKLLFVVS